MMILREDIVSSLWGICFNRIEVDVGHHSISLYLNSKYVDISKLEFIGVTHFVFSDYAKSEIEYLDITDIGFVEVGDGKIRVVISVAGIEAMLTIECSFVLADRITICKHG